MEDLGNKGNPLRKKCLRVDNDRTFPVSSDSVVLQKIMQNGWAGSRQGTGTVGQSFPADNCTLRSSF